MRNQGGRVEKIREIPHERRHGWLKNDNPPGDLSKARRCGAKTRRATRCQCPAMANGRCRLHGGLSTGPRTVAGIDAIRRGKTKHDFYSNAAIIERRRERKELRALQDAIAFLKSDS